MPVLAPQASGSQAAAAVPPRVSPLPQEPALPKEILTIGFRLGRREFGLEISQVQRVIRMVEITEVPHSLPFLEGVINLMGAIVPVVSLRRLFGMPGQKLNLREHIIIGEKGGQRIGLIVDGVSDLMTIPRSAIDPPTSITPLREFLLGVARQPSKIVFLLKLDRLLDIEKAMEAQAGMDFHALANELGDRHAGKLEEAEGPPDPATDGIREVLHRRAEEISRRVEIEDIPTRQILTFSLGDEWYGMDTTSVHSIVNSPRLVRVPCAPVYVRGVINLRGEIVTVLDIKRIFGLDGKAIPAKPLVIVAVVQQSYVGLMVDSVHDVIDLPTNRIERPLSTIEKVRADFIEGEARLGDRLLGILKMETITSPAQAV